MDTRLKTIMELDGKDYKKTLKEIAGLENEYYNDSIKSVSKLSKLQEKLSKKQSKNAKSIKSINKEIKKELKDFGKLSDTEQAKQEKNHKKKINLLKKERTQTTLTNNIAIKGIRDNITATKNLITAQETQQKLMVIIKKNAIEMNEVDKKTLDIKRKLANLMENQKVIKNGKSGIQATDITKSKELRDMEIFYLKELEPARRRTSEQKRVQSAQELEDMNKYYSKLEKSSKKEFEKEQELIKLQEKKIKIEKDLQLEKEKSIAQAKEEYKRTYLNTSEMNRYEDAVKKLNKQREIGAISQSQLNSGLEKEKHKLKEASKSADRHTKSTENLANATIRYLRWAGTIAGVLYATKRAWDATLGSGIQMSKMVENNTYGIAALISANTRMVDSYGNTLTPMQKFVAGQKIAKTRMKELRVEAMKTPATFRQITDVFQQAIGQTMGMDDAFGKTVDEIGKNTVQLSSRFSQVAGAIGMPMDRVKEEIRSALTGNVSTDSIISTMLFGSPTKANAKIKEARLSTNGLKKLFDEVFKSFDILSTTRSFDKGLNQMKGAWEIAMGDIVSKSGMFKDITDAFYEMSNGIINNTDDIVKKFDGFYNGIKNIADTVGKITEAFLIYKAVGIAGSVATSTAAFVASNLVYDATTKKIRILTTAQRLLNATILKNPYIIAIASMAIGINYLIDKTNELHEKTKQVIIDSQSNKVNLLGTKEQLQKELTDKERMLKVWKDKLLRDNKKYGEDSNIVGIDKAQINGITEAVKKLNEQLDGTSAKREKAKKDIENAKEETKLIIKLAVDMKSIADAKKIIAKEDTEEIKLLKQIKKHTEAVLELKKKLAVEEGRKKPIKLSIDILKKYLKIEEKAVKTSQDNLGKIREDSRKKDEEKAKDAVKKENEFWLKSYQIFAQAKLDSEFDYISAKWDKEEQLETQNEENKKLFADWYYNYIGELGDEQSNRLADTLNEAVQNTFKAGSYEFSDLGKAFGDSLTKAGGSAIANLSNQYATIMSGGNKLAGSIAGGLGGMLAGGAISFVVDKIFSSKPARDLEKESETAFKSFIDNMDKATKSLESMGNIGSSTSKTFETLDSEIAAIKSIQDIVARGREKVSHGEFSDKGGQLWTDNSAFRRVLTGSGRDIKRVAGSLIALKTATGEWLDADDYKVKLKELAKLEDERNTKQIAYLGKQLDFSTKSFSELKALTSTLDYSAYEKTKNAVNDVAIEFKKTGVMTQKMSDTMNSAYSDTNYAKVKDYLGAFETFNGMVDNSKANIKELQLRKETPREKVIRLANDVGSAWSTDPKQIDYIVSVMEKSGGVFTNEEKKAALAMYDYSDSIIANRKAVEDAIKGQEYGQAQFIDSLNGTSTALDYAKKKVGLLGDKLPDTKDKLIALRQSFIDNDGAINTYEQAVIDATLATKPLVKAVADIGLTAEEMAKKIAEALKQSRDSQLATIDYVWEHQKNAQTDLLNTQITNYNTQKSELNNFLQSTTSSISTLESAFSSLSTVVADLRGITGGTEYTLQSYYKSMSSSLSLSHSNNYDAFKKELDKTINLSSVLKDTNAFTTSNDQKFAQLVAANQFDSMQSTALTQIDYLKMIENNTRTQISGIVAIVNALGGQITSIASSASNQPPSIAQREADYLDKYSQVADHYALAPKGSNVEKLKASGMTLLEYAKFNFEHYGKFQGREFAVGTPSVPRDMIAKIHQSEIIVPASFSDGLRNGDLQMGDQKSLIKEVQILTSRVEELIGINETQAQHIKKMDKRDNQIYIESQSA